MKPLIPLIVIVICIATYFFYISPTVDSVQALRSQLAQYNNALNKTKELKNTRESMLATYNSIAPTDIDKLKEILPDTFDSVRFANDLSVLASQHGLIPKNLKISATQGASAGPSGAGRGQAISVSTKSSAYQTTGASFSVEGQYSQVMGFIHALETSARLMDISAVSVKTGGDSKTGGTTTLDFGISLQTYSLK